MIIEFGKRNYTGDAIKSHINFATVQPLILLNNSLIPIGFFFSFFVSTSFSCDFRSPGTATPDVGNVSTVAHGFNRATVNHSRIALETRYHVAFLRQRVELRFLRDAGKFWKRNGFR